VTVAAIPGTRSPARLEQNAAALELTLDAEALAALDPLSDRVRGARYLPAHTAEVALAEGSARTPGTVRAHR
jgi:diketogulonate reductase-like aldo/keto reductase